MRYPCPISYYTFSTFLVQEEMGDRLLPCFNSESQIPFSDVNLYTGHAHAPEWGPDSSVSEVSTIQLEFRDLTMITGNTKYQVYDDKCALACFHNSKINIRLLWTKL